VDAVTIINSLSVVVEYVEYIGYSHKIYQDDVLIYVAAGLEEPGTFYIYEADHEVRYNSGLDNSFALAYDSLVYYVRTDGSDSNDGLGPGVDRAFLTPNHAISVIVNNGLASNKLWIAPGEYEDLSCPLKSFQTNNLPINVDIEGDTSGIIFSIAAGLIIVGWVYLKSTACSNLRLKNIVAFYSNIDMVFYTTPKSAVTIINCVTVDSEASFLMEACDYTVINCTAIGEGFYCYADAWNPGFATFKFYNCIAVEGFHSYELDTVEYYNCMCPTGGVVGPGQIVENHVYAPPVFVDVLGGDYHLVAGSGGIGTGVVVEGYSPDIYGAERGILPDRGVAQVLPPEPELIALDIVQIGAVTFQAIAYFDNDTHEDVTESATWGTISPVNGIAFSVTATYEGLEKTESFIDYLYLVQVEPLVFKAMCYWGNNMVDVTEEATWVIPEEIVIGEPFTITATYEGMVVNGYFLQMSEEVVEPLIDWVEWIEPEVRDETNWDTSDDAFLRWRWR